MCGQLCHPEMATCDLKSLPEQSPPTPSTIDIQNIPKTVPVYDGALSLGGQDWQDVTTAGLSLCIVAGSITKGFKLFFLSDVGFRHVPALSTVVAPWQDSLGIFRVEEEPSQLQKNGNTFLSGLIECF